MSMIDQVRPSCSYCFVLEIWREQCLHEVDELVLGQVRSQAEKWFGQNLENCHYQVILVWSLVVG